MSSTTVTKKRRNRLLDTEVPLLVTILIQLTSFILGVWLGWSAFGMTALLIEAHVKTELAATITNTADIKINRKAIQLLLEIERSRL
jgi:hypothetical protein